MYNLMEIKFLPFFVTPSCPSKINLPFPLTEIISLGFGWCPLDVTILPLTKTFPDSIKDIMLLLDVPKAVAIRLSSLIFEIVPLIILNSGVILTASISLTVHLTIVCLIFFKFSPELEKIRHCRCRNTTLSN